MAMAMIVKLFILITPLKLVCVYKNTKYNMQEQSGKIRTGLSAGSLFPELYKGFSQRKKKRLPRTLFSEDEEIKTSAVPLLLLHKS